ncbi:hypothetical protein D0469_06410 [Peribacillus saganii]|uniref:Uncharacterized protein n=1 Tax=Peribacillus saganii TaxID=2303992 RepID=A0A372LR81_9BACI|nr:hypothetical protein [Peribacillus saganii]RFU70556.1 hypothetical protein D0469_06410 [Peribacillus saganii]
MVITSFVLSCNQKYVRSLPMEGSSIHLTSNILEANHFQDLEFAKQYLKTIFCNSAFVTEPAIKPDAVNIVKVVLKKNSEQPL